MPDKTVLFSSRLSADLAASEEEKRKLLEKSGRLTSRARFERLFDAGSFTEIASFLGDADTDEADRLLCAYGAVNGECVYAFSQEFSQTAAAFSRTGAKKLLALYELAQKRPAPIVGFFDASGSDLKNGLELMGAFSSLIAASASYKGIAPQIALIAGACGASLGAFAAGFDLIFMERGNGELFINAPFNVEEETNVSAHAKAESAAAQGQIHACFDSESALIDAAKKALGYLPESCDELAPIRETADDANRASAVFEKIPEASELLEDVFDRHSLFELSAEFGFGVRTGFASLCGVSVAFAACTGSDLSRKDLIKLIRFVDLCDLFDLPLLQFVNTTGFCAKCESKHGLADLIARLSLHYASADLPMITLYCGKAHGSVLSVFATKALGADLVYATPSAALSLLAPESAVAFSENEKLKGAKDPIRGRAELIESYLKTEASPVCAARAGLIDDILEPQQVRARLAFAVNMLLGI